MYDIFPLAGGVREKNRPTWFWFHDIPNFKSWWSSPNLKVFSKMYLTSLSLKKTPRMFWGFFRIRKDRHLLRVVHPTAREKKKHHRWKRCTGWHLSEVFWPHSQPGLKHSAWLGSSMKKGNKVVRKSWEIRKFLLHNSRKNQAKKKTTPCFVWTHF